MLKPENQKQDQRWQHKKNRPASSHQHNKHLHFGLIPSKEPENQLNKDEKDHTETNRRGRETFSQKPHTLA